MVVLESAITTKVSNLQVASDNLLLSQSRAVLLKNMAFAITIKISSPGENTLLWRVESVILHSDKVPPLLHLQAPPLKSPNVSLPRAGKPNQDAAEWIPWKLGT